MSRELVDFVNSTTAAREQLTLPLSAAPVAAAPLSGAPQDGDGAAMADLPAGWSAGGGTASAGFELVVVSGELSLDGETLRRESYVAVPAGAPLPALGATQDAMVFVDVSDRPDRPIVTPGSEEGWEKPTIPGPPPGLVHKVLWGDPETGAFSFLLRIPAGYHERRAEWHDCSEQCLLIEGSLWHDRGMLGRGGTMRDGDYFWRPPHGVHSPMGTEDGGTFYMTTDGRLVNHYVEVEGLPSTPGADPFERLGRG